METKEINIPFLGELFPFERFQFPRHPILDQKLDTNRKPKTHESFATNVLGKFESMKF